MKKILGLDSAYDQAVNSGYCANMTVSAKLVIEMAERILELEEVISKAYDLNSDIGLLFYNSTADQ